ncbi:conserved hypothetical protein [Klebsiella quasipneumoniae subsp. similipneumoniae]|nr:conserved hypothetical protein [Klebsiella quasipneumoniae subsp. similipneumoniae]
MLKSNFMSALRIELKKGFTNEGVVHELSWIPGVQTGGVLCAICCGKGIDLRQKIPHQRKRLPPRAPLCAFRLSNGG